MSRNESSPLRLWHPFDSKASGCKPHSAIPLSKASKTTGRCTRPHSTVLTLASPSQFCQALALGQAGPWE